MPTMITERAPLMDRGSAAIDCGRAIQVPERQSTFHRRATAAPRAATGIEAACCVAKERKPTNCCVRRAGGEAKKCLLPFCRGEVGIATLRWRTDSLRGR